MKKSRIAAVIAAGAIAGPVAFVPAAEAHPWTPAAKKAFVSSCVKSGGPRNICTRAMRCVKRQVTIGDLARVTSNKKVERRVTRIARKCTEQIVG